MTGLTSLVHAMQGAVTDDLPEKELLTRAIVLATFAATAAAEASEDSLTDLLWWLLHNELDEFHRSTETVKASIGALCEETLAWAVTEDLRFCCYLYQSLYL